MLVKRRVRRARALSPLSSTWRNSAGTAWPWHANFARFCGTTIFRGYSYWPPYKHLDCSQSDDGCSEQPRRPATVAIQASTSQSHHHVQEAGSGIHIIFRKLSMGKRHQHLLIANLHQYSLQVSSITVIHRNIIRGR